MKRLRRWVIVTWMVTMSLASWATVSAEPPANGHFQATWDRTDKPVAEGRAGRTWMWGPQAFTPQLSEPYDSSPGGQRSVQYFDKSRMEITQPGGDPSSVWYVTNGLLSTELITGRVQVGNDQFEERGAAEVNVAGDANDPAGPTYATFSLVLDAPPAGLGAAITQRIGRDGMVTEDGSLAGRGVTVAHLDEVTGHAIAAPFWAFMNSSGVVWQNGGYADGKLFENPFFATGRPITEAYWAAVQVGGDAKLVLIQCFERRCLTYTPDNDPAWQVEAGNVGQHYYQWRYGSTPEPPPAPPPAPEPPPSNGIPAEGDVLYQSNLSDWPVSISDSDESVGAYLEDEQGYFILTEPGGILYASGPDQEFGDASYSIDMRLVPGSGDSGGCMVFRGSDAGTYQLCLLYSADLTLGTLALYLDFGAGDVVELNTYELPGPVDATQWTNVKAIAQSNHFWFFVNGSLVGEADHAGSQQGFLLISALNIDTFTDSIIGFRNYTVRSISSGGPAPQPEPTPPPPSNATTFGGGVWLVGVDIPAGTYRNSDSSDGCYWERLSGLSGELDDINANEFTYGRTIVTISSSDYAFSSEDCGTWTSDLSPITASPTADFGDGTWIVGVDVAAGTWRNSDSSGGCYWARLDGFSGELDDINANEFTYDPQTVSISPSDEGFETSGCGTWTYLGN